MSMWTSFATGLLKQGILIVFFYHFRLLTFQNYASLGQFEIPDNLL